MFLKNIPKEYKKSINFVICALPVVLLILGVLVVFKAKSISIKSSPPGVDITLAEKQARIINNAQVLITEATKLLDKTTSQFEPGYDGPVAMQMPQGEEYKVSAPLVKVRLNKINHDLQQLKEELQAFPQSEPDEKHLPHK